MKTTHFKAVVGVALINLLTVGLMVGLARPASARPTDDVSWVQCNNRQTLKTKVLKNGAGQKPGTLYLYRCSNGIFARVKSEKKRTIMVNVMRSDPKRILHAPQTYGYHAMTNMLYIKSGACYSAHGYISVEGATADVKVCL